MPLCEVNTLLGLVPNRKGVSPDPLRQRTKEFGAALPDLMSDNSAVLGLGDDLPAIGVQVTFGNFGHADINAPDFWVKLDMCIAEPSKKQWKAVRKFIQTWFLGWFESIGYELPKNYAVDIIWGGISHGFLCINGEKHKW